ncbi:hypothetical protein HT031_003738 [Scenedesmus sp. PABB004]|nr:hypothetical protein HT031_003738 [Scenedesmus sp. PABB004]
MARRAPAAALGLLLLAAGALAQECDPAIAGTELVDMAEPIGVLACKVPPSVNLTDVMSRLTGVLADLPAEQLSKLPGLVKLTIGVDPAALAPLLSLTGAQMDALLPLLRDVKPAALAAVFPLLAGLPGGTLERTVRFLKAVGKAQLAEVLPLFSRITANQLAVMRHALTVLPAPAWSKLAGLVQALGPVTDSVVTAKAAKGALPAPAAAAPAPAAPAASTASDVTSFAKGPIRVTIRGRRLLQGDADAAAGAALAAAALAAGGSGGDAPAEAIPGPPASACDPGMAGIEIGVALVADFGKVVCKFSAAKLKPVLAETLSTLNAQPPAVLANLPLFVAGLTALDPAAFNAFFQIPTDTLAALIPALGALDPAAVGAALTVLGGAGPDTVAAMALFLNAVPESQIKVLLPVFGGLTDDQVDMMAALLRALSPGQVTLALHLLSTFGFAVDAIGAAIPAASPAGGGAVMIGPGACDLETEAGKMSALAEPVGRLACRLPPGADAAAIMGGLTGTLQGLSLTQLRALPQLIKATIGLYPAAVQPLLSLSGGQVSALLPLLTEVSAEKLKVVLPVLAAQPPGATDRMVRFLKGVSRAQLEAVTPALARMTPAQLDLLSRASGALPAGSMTRLAGMVRGVGPVASSTVVAPGKGRVAAAGAAAGLGGGLQLGPLAQQAGAAGCEPFLKGIEVAGALLPKTGAVACKFGAEQLEPVLLQVLEVLNAQPPSRLANLPALTQAMAHVQPAAAEALLRVPPATLQAVLPALASADAATLQGQLGALGGLDASLVKRMVYFIKATPAPQLARLVPAFGSMTDAQVDSTVALLNSLTPGQLQLALQLLDVFGFKLDAIGAAMPQSGAAPAGGAVMIGPVRVTLGGVTLG